MTINAARINLVIHSLSVIKQSSKGYYRNILSRVYIDVSKNQVDTCSHHILTQLLTLNGLPELMSVKYLYATVYCFVTRVCKHCNNFPFYHTGVVHCLKHKFNLFLTCNYFKYKLIRYLLSLLIMIKYNKFNVPTFFI